MQKRPALPQRRAFSLCAWTALPRRRPVLDPSRQNGAKNWPPAETGGRESQKVNLRAAYAHPPRTATSASRRQARQRRAPTSKARTKDPAQALAPAKGLAVLDSLSWRDQKPSDAAIW